MSHSRSFTTALAAALALAPFAAQADLLVTRDGATVETRGGWRVEGRQVVFTLPNGQLSSLRTDDVDLDGSALATARAVEAASAPPAAVAATATVPVLRLTEKDFPPVTESGDAAEGSDAAAAAPAEAVASQLEVVSWDRVPNDANDGVQIYGTLRNNGTGTMIAPALTISVYGEEGGLLAMTEASINLTAIPAGKSANFRADFPGLPDFAAARFSPSGRGYEGSAPPAGEDDGSGGEPLPDAADAGEAVGAEEYESVLEPMTDLEPPPA